MHLASPESLSEFTRLITGTRSNGPKFFGLRAEKGLALKSAGENSSEPIEVPWSPRKTREHAQIDEARSIGHRPPNPRLVQAIVRAHVWLKLLTNGTHDSIEALAGGVRLHPKHIRNSIRLAFLSPTATKAILDGQQRATLALGDLDEEIALSWHKQQRQQESCFQRIDQPAARVDWEGR